MLQEIATLRERIAAGGDWRGFKDELTALHQRATTEEEYVTLLENFVYLVGIADEVFEADVYQRLLPVMRSEYRMFLNFEAMEDDYIVPVKLERITRREILAGRLNPDDGLRQLAIDSASVMGETANLAIHHCRRGDWLFFGAGSAAVVAFGLQYVGLSPLWIIPAALVVSYFPNDRERKRVKAELEERREQEEITMQNVIRERQG